MSSPVLNLGFALPGWVADWVNWTATYPDPETRMRLAVGLSRENVVRGTGGPFGAAVFERESGVLVAVGVNQVEEQDNCTLHAETVALMLAQARVGSFTLGAEGMPEHELVTSCEPCAMCLGAVLWSGVTHVRLAAQREDAEAVGFDEGPVFPQSYVYLQERGIAFNRGPLREEARAVLELYRSQGGMLYNPWRGPRASLS